MGVGGTLHEVDMKDMGVLVVFDWLAFVIQPVPKAGFVISPFVAGISIRAAVFSF